jgi:plastocyanin
MRRLVLPVAGLCGLALAVVPALASDKQINASGTSWSPDDVTVNPGDKVTISNPNGGNHDLYWKDGAPGHPGPAPNIGDTSTWSSERTFSDADVGKTFRFYCSVHSDDQGVGMDGIVRVVAAGGSGTTTTTNPPPGGTTTTSTTPPPPPPPGGTTTSTTPPPPSGGDTTAPRATRARSSASRRGVTVRLTLSEAATVTLRVFRGPRRVARRVFDVQSGAVKLRIRRALRPGRYRLRLTLVDDAGNRSSKSLRARVK